jgi:hypothetical protein
VVGLTTSSSLPPQTQFIPLTSFNQQSSTGGSSSSGDGSRLSSSRNSSRETPQTSHHVLTISDVVLTETGQSIVGKDAPGAIQPVYTTDHFISLTLRGTFQTAPSTTLEHMATTLEPGLVALSFLGKQPSVRVLMNRSILLQPVSASEHEIIVKLNSRAIPDLWLAGSSHELSVEAGELIARTQVKVGTPLEDLINLSPVIHQVEILRDSDNKPINLRLTGLNLMHYYRFSHIQVDSKPVFGHQCAVIDENGVLKWEKTVHLPQDFSESGTHTITYISPFGGVISSFEGSN